MVIEKKLNKGQKAIITIGIIVVLALTAVYAVTIENGKGVEYSPSVEQVKSLW